ncbi:dihydropteroate synthase [Fibrella sp. WM1]|uniref:dihydropteroate synthase n=1 Tax=Fibrella musci TaxID=3242485 RepID=UPI00351FDA21
MLKIKKKTLNCRGRLVDLNVPRVMGILNITPDSFYAGSRYSVGQEVETAARMLDEGATFLDVGGYSTRPGAADISPAEEADRVLPVIEGILDSFPDALISVDTFRADVARQAVEQGAALINDVAGGTLDPAMFATVAELGVPYVLMHLRGTPQTMQAQAQYTNVPIEVIDELASQLARLRALGPVADIILDPGFGFAKTPAHNFQLLNELDALVTAFDEPLLVGLSRKTTIWKTLQTTADKALNGTTVLNTVALLRGASILRVHDVREAVEAVMLTQALKKV